MSFSGEEKEPVTEYCKSHTVFCEKTETLLTLFGRSDMRKERGMEGIQNTGQGQGAFYRYYIWARDITQYNITSFTAKNI